MIKEVLRVQAPIIVTIVIIVLSTKFPLTHILTAVNGLVASYSTDVRGTVSAKKPIRTIQLQTIKGVKMDFSHFIQTSSYYSLLI